MTRITHPFGPIYDKESEILILGTMPSAKSREAMFPYSHPQNRFWKVLGDIFNEVLDTKEKREAFLHLHHIALWDVVKSCEITGASDSSIKNVTPNDVSKLLRETKIHTIFNTGKKSYELYQKYIYPKTKISSILLPSSSPANCRVPYETMMKEYNQIKSSLNEK